jgi:hypothetical protein
MSTGDLRWTLAFNTKRPGRSLRAGLFHCVEMPISDRRLMPADCYLRSFRSLAATATSEVSSVVSTVA